MFVMFVMLCLLCFVCILLIILLIMVCISLFCELWSVFHYFVGYGLYFIILLIALRCHRALFENTDLSYTS